MQFFYKACPSKYIKGGGTKKVDARKQKYSTKYII